MSSTPRCPNHFHLLVTPASEEGLPKMMQSVGRAMPTLNKRHQSTGTLWKGATVPPWCWKRRRRCPHGFH